jgi:glycerol-3-phosphate dehydrogenase
VAELDYGQYAMVRKALHERICMLRNAPFLAHPLELLVPCANWFDLVYFSIGMKMYDWISGAASLFPSRILSKADSLRRMPSLRGDRLVGTVSYADGQFDDARYGLTLAQTFARQGGELLNYAKVVGFERDGQGRLSAVDVEDQLSGEKFRISAKVFVNCTGPFADHIRLMATPGVSERLRFSKGVHILLPIETIKSRSALLIPKTADGRVVFAIPWFGSLLVGTTDDEAKLTDEMVVTPSEVDYLLRQVNQHLNVSLSANDVQAAFAGLRPLVASKGAVHTKKLIRDHEVEVDEKSGLVSVLGGKWTTYRAMAEDGINHAQIVMTGSQTPCRTRDFALAGSRGYSADFAEKLAKEYGLTEATAAHLAQKFGTDALMILALAKQNPDLQKPIVAGGAAIRAEVVYAVREEMAQSIEDLLARRIGVQFHSWKDAEAAAPTVGQLLGRELGWSDKQTETAVAAYIASIKALFTNIGIQRG